MLQSFSATTHILTSQPFTYTAYYLWTCDDMLYFNNDIFQQLEIKEQVTHKQNSSYKHAAVQNELNDEIFSKVL